MIKKIVQYFSKKSARAIQLSDLFGTYAGFGTSDWHEVKASLAWHYFAQVQPINRAVNLITQELQSIPFVLENKTSGQIIREPHPGIGPSDALRVINDQPNSDKTGSEFKKSNGASYIVCGECYIMVIGALKPQELFYINPSEIIVESDGDYIPSVIRWQNESFALDFYRTPENTFYTKDGTKQIYQIMDFNPFYKYGNQRGFSKLSSIYFEIEQYIQGNKHNITSLKKGSRPGGALIVEDGLNKEQVEILKAQIQKFYSGSENAGNVMVLNKGREFKELSLNNRDMEYSKLSKQTGDRLYNSLEIPGSFFDNSASTFNNKLIDRANLYLFAVMPLADRLGEEWTNFLMPRYKNGDKWRITYLEKEIPALEIMFDDANLRKAQSGVFTVNELRELYGKEDIGPEGDVIYQALNLVPVGTPQEENKKMTARMIEVLKKNNYSDEHIRGVLNVINR